MSIRITEIRRFSPGVDGCGNPAMYEDEEGEWIYADDVLVPLRELLAQIELPCSEEVEE